MRAIVLGLVGAVVLVGGAAQAKKAERPEVLKKCLITERDFTIAPAGLVPKSRILSADLIGKPAKIIRSASAKKWDAVEVEVSGKRYAIRFDTTPHATPAVMASSFAGSDGSGINWSRHGDSLPIASADIYSGPLAGLSLEEGACR